LMTIDDLTDEESEAVIAALRKVINEDRFPRSPRLGPLRSALAKLDPKSAQTPPAPNRLCRAAAGGQQPQRWSATLARRSGGRGDGSDAAMHLIRYAVISLDSSSRCWRCDNPPRNYRPSRAQ
jgi:hypothetical protein